MFEALITLLAVSTGLVVIVVAVAVVLVVLFVTLSMRGRQKRGAQRRGEEMGELRERASSAERERDIAQDEAQTRADPDR